MKTAAVLAALALALAAPAVTAQDPDPTGVLLTVSPAGVVPFAGSGAIPFGLDVGCLDVAQAAADPTVTVTVTDAPAWFNFTEQPVELDPSDCLLGGGRVTANGTLPFTVSASAPGVVLHTVHVKAALGETSSEEPAATFTVAYNSDYSVTPGVQFPLTVTNKTTTFTVTGTQASNAPSMIMVDAFTASDAALVSGFGALQYNNDAGKPDTKTYTITFTAPKGDWETANITLKVYGHYNFPDGSMAGEPMDHKNFTWQVRNGGVQATGGGGGGKDSPAPVGVVTALGLLAFAALRRRQA